MNSNISKQITEVCTLSYDDGNIKNNIFYLVEDAIVSTNTQFELGFGEMMLLKYFEHLDNRVE